MKALTLWRPGGVEGKNIGGFLVKYRYRGKLQNAGTQLVHILGGGSTLLFFV